MPVVVAVLAPFVFVAACAAAARAMGGDPMLGAELGIFGLTAVWLTLLSKAVSAGLASQREMQRCTRPTRLRGRMLRVMEGYRSNEAFVLGPLRPEIFVSRALLETLDADELEAVLLHEEHHQRTLAPLRTLALTSWMRMVGAVPVLVRWMERRLEQLEVDADRYALAGGASPASIASALVKCDRTAAPAGVGYAAAAEVRLMQLLGDHPRGNLASTPIEWVAPVVLSLGIALCHVLLG